VSPRTSPQLLRHSSVFYEIWAGDRQEARPKVITIWHQRRGGNLYIHTWTLLDLAFGSTMKRSSLTNNVYVLSFVATVGNDIIRNVYLTGLGGSLFGFDISSMSAWIGTQQYNDYFNSPDSSLQVRN